ncbi:hypothetical protein KCU61_g3804, partial [Aureobasidium melanogenum]
MFTTSNMHLSLSIIVLSATVALGQTYCPASSIFRVKSILTNSTDFNTTSSFGYVKSSAWYSDIYHAILDPAETWTGTRAYTTDIFNQTASYLEFPDDEYEHTRGLTLNSLTHNASTDFAEINGADGPDIVPGTKGVYYHDAGKIQYSGSDGQNVHWHGCPNRDLEWASNVTRLGYRLHNATVPKGCYDLDLVIEYMVGWATPGGLPPKCWSS